MTVLGPLKERRRFGLPKGEPTQGRKVSGYGWIYVRPITTCNDFRQKYYGWDMQ